MTTYTYTVTAPGVPHLAVDHWRRHPGQRDIATTPKESPAPIIAMHRGEMVVMPSVLPLGRPLAEASPSAKTNQVRAVVRRDWSISAASNENYGFSEANEYDWRPRTARSSVRRDAEAAQAHGVARRSSRAGHHSRDLRQPKEAQPTLGGMRNRSVASLQQSSRPLGREVDAGSPRSSRRRLNGASADPQLRSLGAWSDSSLVYHKGLPAEFFDEEEETRQYVVPSSPLKSPQYRRLPSPELEPLSTDHGFCSCCVDIQDDVHRAWYHKGRAKVDAQLESALAHIAAMSSGGRRRLE